MAEVPIQFSGDENHVHPRHTGHRRLDLVLALSAIFISAVSLYVAVEHGRIERQLVAANSWPFMSIRYAGGPDKAFYTMTNAGVGPAKLHGYQVRYRGEVVPDIFVLLERCCGLPVDRAERTAQGYPQYDRTVLDTSVFRPGEAAEVMSVPISGADHGLSSRFRAAYRQITFRGCYCSVFDECWSTDFVGLETRSVRSCDAGPSFNDDMQGTSRPN